MGSDPKADRKKKIEQEYVYALEAMMGDAVEHEREEKTKALKEAEEQNAKKLKAKSQLIKLVTAAAIFTVLVVFGALWVWFEEQVVPVETIAVEIRDVIKEEIANSKEPVRQWAELSDKEKEDLRIEAYVRFPEILAHNQRGKYYNVNEWMIKKKRVVHPFVRDIFRINIGKLTVWNGKEYKLPGVYSTLIDDAPKIKAYIESRDAPPNDLGIWLVKVKKYADYRVEEDGTKAFVMIEDRFRALSQQ